MKKATTIYLNDFSDNFSESCKEMNDMANQLFGEGYKPLFPPVFHHDAFIQQWVKEGE